MRDLGLRLGWVDVKVAAIDETWSGLKFVRRLAGPLARSPAAADRTGRLGVVATRESRGGSGALVMPRRRSRRATSISPKKRQATAPIDARPRNHQAWESPPRAVEPKSMAAYTR